MVNRIASYTFASVSTEVATGVNSSTISAVKPLHFISQHEAPSLEPAHVATN